MHGSGTDRSDHPPRGAASAARRPTDDPNRFVIPARDFPGEFARRVEGAPGPAAEPRPAATLVLARDGDDGPEVVLLRRPRASGFASGAWVFPGGRVDAADRSVDLVGRTSGPSSEAWTARMGLDRGGDAHGYVMAALRETFEETGVWIGCRESGIGNREPGVGNREQLELQRLRGDLLAGKISFLELAERADLRLDTGRLRYLAHWVTPKAEPKRYDTRFFLAAMPEGAEVEVHAAEITGARWLTPGRAVDAYRAGDLVMLPPTVHTLTRLAEFGTVGAMLAELEDAPVPRIEPRMSLRDDGVVIEIIADDGSNAKTNQ